MNGPERDEEMREVVREVLRELVPRLLSEVIAESAPPLNGGGTGDGHATGDGDGKRYANGNGASYGHAGERRARARKLDDDPTVVPRVPAPPVAAVLRPSTWDRPAAPGEIIGRSAPAQAHDPPASGTNAQPAAQASAVASEARGSDARVESVAIDTDEDLERFVRQLMSRIENPRERLAIRTGRVRFALCRSPAAAAADGAGARGPVTRVEKGAVTERVIRGAAAAGTRLVLAPGTVLTPLARDQAKRLGIEIERERRC